MMRTLLIAVVIGALAWAGYWVVGSRAKQAALQGWLDDRRAAGWVADSADLSVQGFPNRFDTTVRDLNLADPRSGWAWAAPWFQIFALSYQPNHIIAVWPPEQSVANPGQRITITNQDMRGSVRFTPSTNLALDQAIIQLDTLALRSSQSWTAALGEGQLAIRRAEPGAAPDHAYDVNLKARSLQLPEGLRETLDPAGLLPQSIQRADIRLTPVFDAPWDRIAVETGPPALQILNVGNVSFQWGDMSMTIVGRLDADAQGLAQGDLNIIARNWREMLDISVRAGWLPVELRGSLETGLALLARATGQTNRLDVTLMFKDGQTRLGPLPIGKAPRLN